MNGKYLSALVSIIMLFSLPLSSYGRDKIFRPKIYLEKKIIAEKKRGKVRYFEVHNVREGDSLWKIFISDLGGRPEEFTLYTEAFMGANPGVKKPSLIKKGSRVRLPVNVGSLKQKARLKSLVEADKIIEHRVQKGDNLWKISREEFKTVSAKVKFIEEVKRLNPFITNADLIFPGQNLYIPKLAYFMGQDRSPAGREVASINKSTTGWISGSREDFPEKISPPGMDKERVADAERASPAARTLEDQIREAEGREDEAVLPSESPAPKERGAGMVDLSKPLLSESTEDEIVEPDEELAYPEKSLGEKEEQKRGVSTITEPQEEGGEGIRERQKTLSFIGLAGDILNILGEKVVLTGEVYLPIGGGGELILKMEEYPLVRFQRGTNVILDLNSSLPEGVKEALPRMWAGYSVLSLQGVGNVSSFIRELIDAGEYYSVKEGDKSQLTIGDKVSITLDSDLIILKEEDSILKGEVYALRKVEAPDLTENQSAVYSYCLKSGITVIPYYLDRSIMEGFIISYHESEGSNEDGRESLPGGVIRGIKRILDLTGVKNSLEEKISISGQGGAFSLTIKPDLIFWVKGIPYILDPERFSEPIIDLLKKEGYRIFRVKNRSIEKDTIKALLKVANMEYGELEKGELGGGKGKGYILRASGVVVKGTGGEKNILFVKGNINLGMRDLLFDNFATRVITY